jgi:hypothetical protein
MFHYVDTNVNKINSMDWAPEAYCNKVRNIWQEGNNLLIWTSYKSMFMTLISLVKGIYAYWLSKTTTDSRKREEEHVVVE